MQELSKNDQELRRIEELNLLEEAGVNAYPCSFEKTHSNSFILENFSDDDPSPLADVAVAGRIMSLRRMGKATFCHIQDEEKKLQIYFKKDEIPDFYENLKLLDIGDFIGVNGYVFRTKMGEISVHSKNVVLLCKSTKILPIAKEVIDEQGNKVVFDEFADKELRYRKRYIDLIVNPDIKEVFKKRAAIINEIRNIFNEKGWLEVETPVLQPIYGGATARPFITHHNALDFDLYLRIADELYLKKLIVGGFEAVYEISKNFRNEGMDRMHNPEYTSLELYVAYKDYNWMMETTENLISAVCKKVNGSFVTQFGDLEIDFTPPFRRAKMFDLFEQYVGENIRNFSDAELVKICEKNEVELPANASRMKILDELFGAVVQPNLIQPTFVIDYPLEMSPLAKSHRSEKGLVERFEMFVAGFELTNAFSELNDPRDQRQRLEEQSKIRAAGDDEAMTLDEDFLNAIEIGMPPTAGLGIGIDRLVMLLTNQKSIRDVIIFPLLRPEKV